MRHHHLCNTAFPIAHQKTTRPYRVKRLRDQQALKETLYGAFGHLKEMGLYAHVPFCQNICQFCEYTVVDPKVGRERDTHTVYFDALMDELKMYRELLDTKRKRLVGFDIGGGTPSMADNSHIERVMREVEQSFDVDWNNLEVSIETTPKIAAANPEKIAGYYRMGIRRISMGVQTTDFRQAIELNRADANQGADYLQRAVDNVRAAGFDSFNLDLMYGFPLSAREREGRANPWARTVQDAIDLGPEHITLYRMRYKGTKMAHLSGRVDLEQVNRQEGEARSILSAGGFHGWPGKNTYSRVEGNSGCSDYLDLRVRRAVPYVGIGLGAQSFSHHTLQYNLGAVTKGLEQYVRSCELGRFPIQDLYHLPRDTAIAKMCSVSFYYGGICLQSFKDAFGISLHERFPAEVEFVKRHGLMEETNDQRLQMTMLGKQCFSGVVSLFYSPSVKEHVMQLAGGEQFVEDPISALQAGRVPFRAQPRAEQPSSARRRRRRMPSTSADAASTTSTTSTASTTSTTTAEAPLSQAALDAGVKIPRTRSSSQELVFNLPNSAPTVSAAIQP